MKGITKTLIIRYFEAHAKRYRELLDGDKLNKKGRVYFQEQLDQANEKIEEANND